MKNKVILLILDGFGLNPESFGNAILEAKTPYFDELLKNYPAVSLEASGQAVGLLAESPGNSQAGHLALGTGQALPSVITQAERDINNGSFFDNEKLKEAFAVAKKRSSKVHLVGILSDVPVHASEEVLFALIEMAGRERAQTKLYLHLFLDGRDTSERSGQKLIERLYLQIRNKGFGSIATIIGRYFAMDRDGHWDRVEKAWQLITQNKGQSVKSPLEGIVDSYGRGLTDENLEPLVADPNGKIEKGDVVILFNSRADRMRQLTQKFASSKIEDLFIVAFTQYYNPFPFGVIYQQTRIEPNLVSYLNEQGKKVCKISETERYAHMTYFFNGGVEEPYKNEDRSFEPAVRQVDVARHPLMAIKPLTKRVIRIINMHKYDLIIVNIPNADSLGHTGNLEAAVKAVEAIDKSLAQIIRAASSEYSVLITADHGNCEYMKDKKNQDVRKEDTSSPVPFIVVDEGLKGKGGNTYEELASMPPTAVLTDVAPTIISILQVPQNAQMNGVDIIKEAIIT